MIVFLRGANQILTTTTTTANNSTLFIFVPINYCYVRILGIELRVTYNDGFLSKLAYTRVIVLGCQNSYRYSSGSGGCWILYSLLNLLMSNASLFGAIPHFKMLMMTKLPSPINHHQGCSRDPPQSSSSRNSWPPAMPALSLSQIIGVLDWTLHCCVHK